MSDSDDRHSIVNVKGPNIAVHGKQDPVIPVSAAKELFAKVTNNTRLIEIDGDHVSILGHADKVAEEFFRPAVVP